MTTLEQTTELEYGMEMPVWALRFEGVDGKCIVRVGDWNGLQCSLEMIYNENLEAMTDTEWFDPTSEQVTITVEFMHVAEFENLEPFEP